MKVMKNLKIGQNLEEQVFLAYIKEEQKANKKVHGYNRVEKANIRDSIYMYRSEIGSVHLVESKDKWSLIEKAKNEAYQTGKNVEIYAQQYMIDGVVISCIVHNKTKTTNFMVFDLARR